MLARPLKKELGQRKVESHVVDGVADMEFTLHGEYYASLYSNASPQGRTLDSDVAPGTTHLGNDQGQVVGSDK